MSLPKYRRVKRCIFCEHKADSVEHGWSAWAIRQFSGPSDRIAGQVDGEPHFDRHQKAIKIRCLCRTRCNQGWMKQLEEAVIPLVGKMGSGKPTTLDVLQQWTVARWAVAKAMVWEHISKTKPIFYTDAERFGLRDGTIPSGATVWLAAHVGRETFFAMATDAENVPGFVPELKAYFTTFAYERLVVQIMSVRSNEQIDAYSVIDCNQRVWSDAIIRIWPAVDAAIWPPSLAIEDAMLERFHKRCSIGEKDQARTITDW